MAFNPKTEYTIVSESFPIEDFHKYKDEFVTRPPYQRKAVWKVKKKQALMDSLFRRYYIPKLVIRRVRLSDDRTVNEIVDGQQRITTVQEFFENKYKLPKTLADLGEGIAGKYYKDLNSEVRKFIDRSLTYQADVILSIDEPNNVNHQIIATDIFWRLQQGETLNYMEVAHAQLSSLSRNFVVKYADDLTFDYDKYEPIDSNPDKMPFFKLLNVDNDRMKHLQFMARFLLIEKNGGYAELGDKKITEYIEEAKTPNGIGDYTFENSNEAVAVRKNLKVFYDIFKDDPMLDDKNGIKEFSVEYYIISVYMLLRHLRMHYVLDDETMRIIREFVYSFDARRRNYSEDDMNMLTFTNKRQQGEHDLEVRDRIMRQIFFEYLRDNNFELKEKDENRVFSELQRIIIYRDGKGFCQECLREGKPEKEAKVSWSEYQADHVLPHSKGGETIIENGELLCSFHNLSKGNRN
jgi:5-methylcytosine-specific restriction endonuclease McrA